MTSVDVSLPSTGVMWRHSEIRMVFLDRYYPVSYLLIIHLHGLSWAVSAKFDKNRPMTSQKPWTGFRGPCVSWRWDGPQTRWRLSSPWIWNNFGRGRGSANGALPHWQSSTLCQSRPASQGGLAFNTLWRLRSVQTINTQCNEGDNYATISCGSVFWH